ncbi:NDP-sugar synthase [Bacteroidales bacterium OttesenSCG-928-M06]|nr:NDP-sugar synthase [Bacteroidales bacterium OttesenSCG-928-M06]
MNYAIIAAGNGSRLKEEGVDIPKPLVEINGIPLLKRLIDVFSKNRMESLSIIINEEMHEVKEYLEHLILPVSFNLVIESTPSSMHSFAKLSPYLQKDKFCLTTVDPIFSEEEFAAYIKAFEKDDAVDGLMAVTKYIDDEKPLHVVVDANTEMIIDFEDKAVDKSGYVSGGIYCLTPRSLNSLDFCLNEGIERMRNYQRQLIKDGLALKAYPFSKIIDVDHLKDLQKAEEFLTEKIKNEI